MWPRPPPPLPATSACAAPTVRSARAGARRRASPSGGGGAPSPPPDPFAGGEAEPGVHHIALEVADLEAGVRNATAVGVPAAEAEPSAGLQGTRGWGLAPKAGPTGP